MWRSLFSRRSESSGRIAFLRIYTQPWIWLGIAGLGYPSRVRFGPPSPTGWLSAWAPAKFGTRHRGSRINLRQPAAKLFWGDWWCPVSGSADTDFGWLHFCSEMLPDWRLSCSGWGPASRLWIYWAVLAQSCLCKRGPRTRQTKCSCLGSAGVYAFCCSFVRRNACNFGAFLLVRCFFSCTSQLWSEFHFSASQYLQRGQVFPSNVVPSQPAVRWVGNFTYWAHRFSALKLPFLIRSHFSFSPSSRSAIFHWLSWRWSRPGVSGSAKIPFCGAFGKSAEFSESGEGQATLDSWFIVEDPVLMCPQICFKIYYSLFYFLLRWNSCLEWVPLTSWLLAETVPVQLQLRSFAWSTLRK